jgi:hypothetical protein
MSDRRTPPRVGSTSGKIRVVAPQPRNKFSRLVKRPGVILGDPARIVDTQTFDEIAWLRKWNMRLPRRSEITSEKRANSAHVGSRKLETELDFTELVKSLESFALHAAYGCAVLAAHRLERNLVSLVATRRGSNPTSTYSLFDDDLSGLGNPTLGRLIKHVIAEFDVSKQLEDKLDKVLYLRNRLVHHISNVILLAARKPGWKQRVIRELGEIERYFCATSREIDRMLDDWLHSRGLSREKVRQLAKQKWRKIREDVVPKHGA